MSNGDSTRFVGLWRHGDFARLWTAQTVSVFGSLITGTALPFTAILVLDAGALEVALLAASGILPGLVFGLPAGVWVDRLRRRPVMIAADIGRALLLVSVPIAYAFDALRIEQLYVVALSAGALTILFDVAYQAYLPTLVSRADLVEGNSKLRATESVAEFSAFSVAGALVQLLTGPIAILVDAVTFVFSAVFVRSIRAPEPAPAPAHGREGMRREAVEGLRVVLRQPLLRSVAGGTVLYSLGFGVFGATYMLYVTRTLGFEPGVLGVIFGVGGLSSLGGAIIARPAGERLGVGPVMVCGLLAMGASMFIIQATPSASVVGAILLIVPQLTGDGPFTAFDVNEVSMRQAITEDRVLGRVNSVMRLTTDGCRLGGTLLGGLLGEVLGLRWALACGAGFALAAGLWLAASPVMALRRAPPAIAGVTPAEA